MPRGVGGRPESVEIVRWGSLVLSRIDSMNWMLDGDGRTTYHTDLPQALMKAAYRVANKEYRRDINRWLEKFQGVLDQIRPMIQQAGCTPVKKGVR